MRSSATLASNQTLVGKRAVEQGKRCAEIATVSAIRAHSPDQRTGIAKVNVDPSRIAAAPPVADPAHDREHEDNPRR